MAHSYIRHGYEGCAFTGVPSVEALYAAKIVVILLGGYFGLHLPVIRGAGCCKVEQRRGAHIHPIRSFIGNGLFGVVGCSVASVLNISSTCSWKFEK